MRAPSSVAVVAAAALLLLAPGSGRACDACGCYAPPARSSGGVSGERWYLSLAEQWTSFGHLEEDGRRVPDPAGQRLESSLLQLVIGAHVKGRLGLQVNVPLVWRGFRRTEGTGIDRGTVSGIGDVGVLARVRLSKGLWLLAGLEAPTGDPRRIAEELSEGEERNVPPSGVHGHDLALGTGTWSGLLGLDGRWTPAHALLDASARLALRRRGAHGYRHADGLLATLAAGGLVHQGGKARAWVQGLLAYESKGKDDLGGEKAEDTALTSVSVGPRLVVERASGTAFEVSIEKPVHLRGSSLQAVEDWRAHAGVTFRF